MRLPRKNPRFPNDHRAICVALSPEHIEKLKVLQTWLGTSQPGAISFAIDLLHHTYENKETQNMTKQPETYCARCGVETNPTDESHDSRPYGFSRADGSEWCENCVSIDPQPLCTGCDKPISDTESVS